MTDDVEEAERDRVEAAWMVEIRRRIDRVLQGEAGIPREDVRAKAVARLRAREDDARPTG